MVANDCIEFLLPDVTADHRADARKLVTCLRLVVDARRNTPAAVVGLTLERARAELEGHTSRRLTGAVFDLLRHCLYADVGVDSFAWFGEPTLDLQSAWSVLEQDRDDVAWLPAVPAPNEAAAATSVRLLEAARRLGVTPDEDTLWTTRAVRAHRGLDAGEQAARELAARWIESRSASAADALALWVECLFDRGALRAARHTLDEHASLALQHPRLARLHDWSRLLFEEDADPSVVRARPVWNGRVPGALVELRDARPEWIARLAGKACPARIGNVVAVAAPSAANVALSASTLRRAVGAVAVAVFVLRELGREDLLEIDVAAGLRSAVPEWRRQLAGACSESASAEHELVVGARPVVRHRRGSTSLRSTLAPNQVRSLALAPVFDDSDEVIGWLRFEFEHHLVPSTRRLFELGAAWRERMSAPCATKSGAPLHAKAATPTSDPTRIVSYGLDVHAQDGPCAEVFREVIEQLAIKTAQRRWWGFDVQDREARRVAEGGAALSVGAASAGGRRALTRALRSSGPVRFDELTPELSISSTSASGVVLPITSRGQLRGLLAIESTRRHDFPSSLVARWAERVRAGGTPLAIAQFRAWHLAQFGTDVHFSVRGARASSWVDELLATARSRAACLVTGPAGSGKRIVARWLHFEGAGRAAPCVVLRAGTEENVLRSDAWSDVLRRAAGGVLVVEDLERWSAHAQARFVAQLDEGGERSSSAPRWIMTAGVSLPELALSGVVRGELCRRLARLETRVPPLAERRVELPRLIDVLLRRFAEQERVALPKLDDASIALLWRQSWPGNVRELENVLFKLVLLHAGQDIDADRIDAMARRIGVELVRKVPSRNADPEIVRAALETTLNLRGSINKTRAALYLGWDPDTLVARMDEFGLGERADLPPRVADAAEDEDVEND